MDTHLLTTKIHIPPPHPNCVPRSRLIEQLNAGLTSKLTIISAPAGFGKSTLVSLWTQQIKEHNRIAWFSIDEGDNDLRRFLTYFIAALQTVDSNIGQGLSPVVQSSETLKIEIIFTTLLNEIAELTNDVVFVLDDYHLLESKQIDQAMNFFLDNLPSQMHLVIISRIDPSLPLSRLRARRQLAEVRANDLRFTSEEAFIFLNKVVGLDLSAKHISSLEIRTEGWIAGLQLAALSMKKLMDREEIIDFINSFTGSNQYIQDYLTDEVLQQLPISIQNFLLQTSILNRLSAPLCDAVLFENDESGGRKETPNGSQFILESLEAANLFILPLDHKQQWYRYHHLFSDLLSHRLNRIFPDRVKELHQNASAWYESEGYIDDAIHHSEAAGDIKRMALIIEDHWQEYIHRGEITKLMHLLDSLGSDFTKMSATLSLAYGWIHHLKGSIDEIPGYIIDVQKVMIKDSWKENIQQPIRLAAIPAMIEILEAIISLEHNQIEKSKIHAKKAISLIPDNLNITDQRLLHGAAGYRLAEAHRNMGEIEQACAVLLEVLENLKASKDYFGTANTVLQIVTLYQESGKTQDAIRLCEDTLIYIEEHQWKKLSPSGLVNVLLADLQVDKGDYVEARKNLEIGRELVSRTSSLQFQILVERVDHKLGDFALPQQPLIDPLTQRELQVLQLIAEDLSNREIGERLHLALDTVKGHNRKIFAKLGVKNRTLAINKAISLNIISIQ